MAKSYLLSALFLVAAGLTAEAGLFGSGGNRSFTTVPPSGSYATVSVDGKVVDAKRNRTVAYRLTVPQNLSAGCPLVLVSHGGSGSKAGYKALGYLCTEYASNGYVVINVNHLASRTKDQHLIDRPADVSFILDQVFAGKIPLPAAFKGTLDLAKIGHVGDSWGAYTALALAGGEFDQGNFFDQRITAFCALSPQGEGEFGCYDNGENDNTWRDITTPVYNLMGSEEVDGSPSIGDPVIRGWRLISFERYPNYESKFQSIIPGGGHEILAGYGTVAQLRYAAQNTRLFLDVYLKGLTDRLAQIGQAARLSGVQFEVKSLDNP